MITTITYWSPGIPDFPPMRLTYGRIVTLTKGNRSVILTGQGHDLERFQAFCAALEITDPSTIAAAYARLARYAREGNPSEPSELAPAPLTTMETPQ